MPSPRRGSYSGWADQSFKTKGTSFDELLVMSNQARSIESGGNRQHRIPLGPLDWPAFQSLRRDRFEAELAQSHDLPQSMRTCPRRRKSTTSQRIYQSEKG